ncbi:NAD P-binding protein [Gloeophyllum trabeum ATCC 11539]|uniref:NAD P-binding protein n=1 Tax=Gloeophyllum trabeum (strain ATCC 11539 / FP-39264 / Madison 617) TaxID=670483 RepID=S7Q0R2_GLOTA|nr:NAD P-binding protein [Gloeophyllum trabeum ATCC 11539]EPQ53082.1 NAD P-binding protein [Gloeophyllum trabeum ATCC 11539]
MGNKPIFIVAGVGNASGTGAAAAKVFAQAGYRTALIARDATALEKLASQLTDAHAFPIKDYSVQSIHDVFAAIRKQWPEDQGHEIRAALWNTGAAVWKPFLEITDEEVKEGLDINIAAAFAFSRNIILEFKKNSLNEIGKRGTLIFTGATASIRGNVTTSSFAAGKFGLRALSQSLAKEFGKQNIHVAHAIIDGVILTGRQRDRHDEDWAKNADVRLDPESIAKSYLFLANQDRSALTWELDLRPAHEKW